MAYESSQTRNPGMVEDKNLNAVSIYATNTRSGLIKRKIYQQTLELPVLG
jgi:hypothetical protein